MKQNTQPPKHHRKWCYHSQLIQDCLAQGMTVKQIATKVQLTERSIYRYKEEMMLERKPAD